MDSVSDQAIKKTVSKNHWWNRLNTKLLLWFLLAAALPILIVGYLSIDASKKSLLNVTLRDARVDSKTFGHRTHDALDDFSEVVVKVRQTSAMEGIARTQANGGIDPVDGTPLVIWKDRVASEFRAVAEATWLEEEFALYTTFRYVDTTGQEIVRVDVSTDGEIVQASENELQSIVEQDYFQETLATEVGELHLSRLEYNHDRLPSEILGPHQSVIRYGTPVVDANGTHRGALIVNYDPEFFLEHYYPDNDQFGPVNLAAIEELKLIVDAEGYFLLHADLDKRFGGPEDRATGVTLQSEFSNIGDFIFSDQLPGIVHNEFLAAQKRERATDGQSTDDGHIKLFQDFAIHFRPVFPDPDDESEYWIAINFLPGRLVNDPILNLEKLLLTLIVGFAAVVIAVSYLASRSISRPVTALQHGVEIIQAGNLDHQVKVSGADEISQLGRAFNHMTANLKDSYEHLEEKVRQRTHELRKFQQAVESATDGVMMMTPTADIVYVNPAWEKQTSYQRSDISGKNLDHLISDRTPDDVRRQLRQYIQEGKAFFSEEIIARRYSGQEYQIQLSIIPIREGDTVLFLVGLQQDITLRKEVDKAKTEFVSLASHQLRTPLSTINWYSEILLGDDLGSLNEEQHKYLQEIYQGNQRMVKLVNDLLNVSRLELGTFVVEPEPTDVKKIIHETVADVAALVQQKHLKVEEEFANNLGLVPLDPNLMRLVIQNLVTNAVKYTSEAGRISISAGLAKNGDIIQGRLVNVDSVVIQVQDTGFGIPADQQVNIFTKLYRADNAREKVSEGTGLGLYMVKSIVDHSDGQIWFTSVENKGSTFVVTIPVRGMKKKTGTKSLTT